MFLMVMVLILKLCCLFDGCLLDFAFVYVKQQWFNVYCLKAIMNDFVIWRAAF
jgi:hypothetical protein